MKRISIILVLAVAAFELSRGAPTSGESSAATAFTPFEERNLDQLSDYILSSTIHKFDAKMPVVVRRLKRFLEAMDVLVTEATSDGEQAKLYTEVRQITRDTLKAVQEDTPKCGLYPVAMYQLGHITNSVAKAQDSQLWNYWTLSNIDEKTLFVYVGYPYNHLDEYKASKKFFDKNQELTLEAKTKANNVIEKNCGKYKEFSQDTAISN